ncbi:MAG: PRC-barrel domain-containing protein [Chloroflexota bacterium]|nr:PRC-barrel domain-containing protein [Chloroflexota bacterium]
MRKGKTIIGKDVLSLADGIRIHSVKDLIIGEENDAVVALLVDEGGLLSGSTVVPIEAVHSFGKDAVVIADASAVVAASSYPRVHAIIDRKESLLGKKVFTDEGQQLGTIGDMYFNETDGQIIGLEVSSGALGDLTKGTSYLPITDVQRSGPDVVFVDPQVTDDLESQVGGLQGTLQDVKDKAGQAGADVKDKAGQAGADLKDKAGQATEGARSGIASKDPEQSLIGRKSGMDVNDENGSVVVANGQRITAEHVARAKETGNLKVLTQAATMGQASEVGDQTGAALEQLGDSAGSMWDKFTRKLSEVTDSTGQRMDQQQTKSQLDRIADAIGRPVSKVILDRDDSVILNLGDIITHQSVQRAHDNGMLDSLLSNVYKGEVTFERDEMRAQSQGDSTVENATGGATVVEELEQKVQIAEAEKKAQEEQKKQDSDAARQQREQEREERGKQRDQVAMEREQEIQASRSEVQGETDPQEVTSEGSTVRTA